MLAHQSPLQWKHPQWAPKSHHSTNDHRSPSRALSLGPPIPPPPSVHDSAHSLPLVTIITTFSNTTRTFLKTNNTIYPACTFHSPKSTRVECSLLPTSLRSLLLYASLPIHRPHQSYRRRPPPVRGRGMHMQNRHCA
jgi:hypothetical protein